MDFSLNISSFKDIIPNKATQVSVYGWSDCEYLKVARGLDRENFIVYNGLSLGDPRYPIRTEEGRAFKSFHSSEKKGIAESCKAGLVSLVFENMQRKQEGTPLIPLLFCMDIEGNEYKPTTPRKLASKKEKFNSKITHKELRRCYKLLTEFRKDKNPKIRQISKIAQETFHFVKLVKSQEGSSYGLQKIDPPWKRKGWKKAWKLRKATSSATAKNNLWRQKIQKEAISL